MPLLASLLAGLGERDGMSRAKPHLAHAALVYAIAVNPGLPALCDLQVKPTTIGIHTRCFDCLDLACGQLVELGHGVVSVDGGGGGDMRALGIRRSVVAAPSRLAAGNSYPHYMHGLWRTQANEYE